MPDSTYHMSEDLQFATFVIAIIVCFCIGAGIWALVTDIKDRWSIEDVEAELDELAADYYFDRPLRRPRLKGWRY